MFKLKVLLKKEKIRILLISSGLAIVILIIKHENGILRNISDFFCIIGLCHLLVGSIRYIHNVGLFKTFSYTAYRRRWNHHRSADNGMRPMSLAEYTQKVIMDETRQRPVGWVLCAGIFWCTIALLPVLFGIL